MKKILFAFSLLLFLSACQQSNRITNISTPPVPVEKDKALADVYQMLDGQW
ncbi:MAG: lipoprotein [Bacteroidota bacterium]